LRRDPDDAEQAAAQGCERSWLRNRIDAENVVTVPTGWLGTY
jgi:hypothetical protein